MSYSRFVRPNLQTNSRVNTNISTEVEPEAATHDRLNWLPSLSDQKQLHCVKMPGTIFQLFLPICRRICLVLFQSKRRNMRLSFVICLILEKCRSSRRRGENLLLFQRAAQTIYCAMRLCGIVVDNWSHFVPWERRQTKKPSSKSICIPRSLSQH